MNPTCLPVAAFLALACASIQPTSNVPGSCGRMNQREVRYVTADQCTAPDEIFLAGITPYDGMFVISA